ncbi:MAG: hypothetical protein ACO3MW_10790 [Rhodospirillales bacterium]
MAAEIFDQHITDASAWMGGDMRQTDAWIHVLSADEIADLDQSLRGVQQRGLAMADVTKDDFPLPVFAPFCPNWKTKCAQVADLRCYAAFRSKTTRTKKSL